MQYKISQCWYPELTTIESETGDRHVQVSGDPALFLGPVKIDRILLWQDGQVLMQCGSGAGAVFAFGRQDAIDYGAIVPK